MKLPSYVKKIFALFLLILFLTSCQDEIIQDTTILDQSNQKVQRKSSNLQNDLEKIDFLKKGLKKKIRAYNNKHRKKNKFFKKYGKLKAKNAVTIKFPNDDDNFLVAVPFKRKKHKNKLLVAYYKNEVRKYTIIKKNKNYKKKKLAKIEKTFIKNSKLLFELTSGNINFNSNARSTITKSFGNCNPRVTNTEIISDCAALITLYFPCSDQTTWFVDSDKGCDNVFDNIDLIGDGYNDPDPDNLWENPDIPDEPLSDYNEPDEGCDDFEFDCGEDGLGNEEDEEDWIKNLIDELCSGTNNTNNSNQNFSIEEPRWGQLANKEEILDEITKVIENNQNLAPIPLMIALKDHFHSNLMFDNNTYSPRINSTDVNRYVYTTEGGWLDFNHVFAAYNLTHDVGPQNALIGGKLIEDIQAIADNHSAYSYEDLYSNYLGTYMFIKYWDDIKEGNISYQDMITEVLDELGVVEPEDAPNFDYIPAYLDSNYPKNYSFKPLTNNQLLEAAKKAFCNKDEKEQIKNIKARENYRR